MGSLKEVERAELLAKLKRAELLAQQQLAPLSADLQRRLDKPFPGAQAMQYGQIKNAVRHTLRTIGHEWVLKADVEDKAVRMYVRRELKLLVKSTVRIWHKNPDRVWLQFRNYCLEIAANKLARQAIKASMAKPSL